MKKMFITVSIFLSLFFLIACEENQEDNYVFNGCDGPLTFADQNLEKVVRDYTGIKKGSIYTSDISGLTSIINHDIVDLRGIECLIGLTDLTLTESEITDISPLSKLKNLSSLWLSNNDISDISSISSLSQLDSLSFTTNNIRDISSLGKLTSLKILWLSDNNIMDISSLSGLKNLEVLGLDKNYVSNISSLSGLTELFTLTLNDNYISDISPLVENNGLTGDIDSVYILNNSLNCSDQSTLSYIDELRDRGVTIQNDCN